MKVAQFRKYGSAREVLEVVEESAVPEPGPNELLVRVRASSVNSIDCAVRRGYGHAFFELKGLSRWPNRPGRDLAGEVVAVGAQISRFQPGEAVYAAILGGANADYAKVPEGWAAPMPRSLRFVEAATLPYSTITAWSALVDAAGLNAANTAGKRVIITRASGGVCSLAVQLVKAWGGYVAATCSTRNAEFVRELGADQIVDYTKENLAEALHDFDVAFDAAFGTERVLLDALRVNAGASYVSIVSPRLKLIDERGLQEGVKRGDELLSARVAAQRALGRGYHWVFAQPNGEALRTVAALVESGKVRAHIDRTFALEQIAEAHEYCEAGKARGKIVIDLGSAGRLRVNQLT